MKKLSIGVAGLGRMGKVYAYHVARQIENARLAAVVDSQEDVLQDFAHQFDDVKTYTSFEDFIGDHELDAVIIATPTSTHCELVTAAARAGKAIFCEKPTALTLAETDSMIAAVQQAGVLFQVGFMRRFDKGYEAAKRQIDEGVIGTPVMIRSISRDPHRTSLEYANPARSGGLIIDMSIHDIDLARWLMNDEIDRVYTEAGVLVYPELAEVGDVDNAMIIAHFSKGGLGNFEASRNAVYGYDIQCEILGSNGGLRVGYLQETPVLTLTRDGVCHDVVPHFPQRFGRAYTRQIEHFVECLQTGSEPRVSYQDARAALQVSLAATISQRRQRPVMVGEVNELG